MIQLLFLPFSKDEIECGKFELKYNGTLDDSKLSPVQLSALGHYKYIGIRPIAWDTHGTSNPAVTGATGKPVFVLQKDNSLNGGRTGTIHPSPKNGWMGSVIFNVILGTFADVEKCLFIL